jgi:predicted DNA repair protein MutK
MILLAVAVLITIFVYGVVGLIVKLDDIGLHLTTHDSSVSQSIGRSMVVGMPKLLALLSVVGIAAMIWVGGHILLVGTYDLGWKTVYGWVVGLEEDVLDAVEGVGAALAWGVNTGISALIGLAVGAAVVAILQLVRRPKGDEAR